MEYTVGSLADLISGNNTPNKPKVKKIAIQHNKLKLEKQNESIPKKGKNKKRGSSISSLDHETQTAVKAFVKKDKHKERKNSTNVEDEQDSAEPSLKRLKNKKRKYSTGINHSTLADDSEEEPPVINEEIEQNLENPIKVKTKKVKRVPDPEEEERTIFVGNVPLKTEKKHLKRVFKKYGNIESLRFRGIPVADPKIPKKIAAITQQFHPDRSSVYCYIRFASKEDARKSLKENGSSFQEHHLKVHLCSNKEKPDETKAIFIGNLSFNAEEEELWKLFESCGPISSVRVVRDSYTGMGKGFAYVNFKDSDAVQLALEMENVKLHNRELRIKLSSVNTAKKNKKKENKANATRRTNWKPNKNKPGTNNGTTQKGKSIPMNNNGFQGATFNTNKKKFKVNKGEMDKKRKIKNIAPISNS